MTDTASAPPIAPPDELSAHGRDLLLGALSASASQSSTDATAGRDTTTNGVATTAEATPTPLPPAPPSTSMSGGAALDTATASSAHSSSFTPGAMTSHTTSPDDLLFLDAPPSGSGGGNTSAPASPVGVAHEVHWEGYVRKKGDWLPRWEERYLVLDGAALTYYNTKDEARSARNLRGRMVLSKVRPENYGKAHGFLIETRGHKHFHLCCATELEKDMWVEMMQAAIDDAAKQQTDGPPATGAGGTALDVAQPSPTQVDLRSFYYAFRQLLISHASSPQFFPKLARDVVLTSNYAPTVPFWGEYHGLDGVLHFFSILYETVEFTAFFVTDIAQAKEGSTAVVAGRETMKNRDNGRKFTQQWQHTIEFAPDGRVKSLTIHADPVAASAVFGCNATSSLSLPMAAVVGNSSQDNPAGSLHVAVFRGEQIATRSAAAAASGGDSDANDSDSIDMDRSSDSRRSSSATPLPSAPPRRVFLGLRLLTDGKTNVYAPSSSASCLARTRACAVDDAPDPKWNSQHVLPFAGSSRGKPCFMLIEAWEVQDTSDADGSTREEIVGVAKVNLAPFLALASTSRTVRESVLHSDIARGAVPQWYTLLSAHETKFSCGRVQLSISFEALAGHASVSTHAHAMRGRFESSASPSSIDASDTAMAIALAATPAGYTSDGQDPSQQRVALAKGCSFRDVKRDNHQFRVGNTGFDVPKRYQMIKAVGQGAYGCVIAASDMETGQAIAIKNIPNAFNDLIDAKRILREIRLMRHLNHPNLVNLVDLVRPPSLHEFNDVYIVTDLMETDLHRVIHSNQSITDDHVQYFLYQMLVAIHYVHSAQVLHRDLKPSNILVNSDCDLKLCDFGLARGVHGLDAGLTEYVVTRWYRAPELLLSSKYDKQMDVWAIGCILAEMLGRRPLFPGHDYLHQLKIIMDVIGSPAEDALDFITNPKAKRFILRQPKKPKVPLASVYPRATPQCLDLLEQMLVFDPRKRITIAAALEHPYLALVRDRSVERTCPAPFDFDFENCELTKPKLQELIFEDVCAFHPDARIPETLPPSASVSSTSVSPAMAAAAAYYAPTSRTGSNSSTSLQMPPKPHPSTSASTVATTSSAPVPMAEPVSSVTTASPLEVFANGKPPRPAPVVLLPPAALLPPPTSATPESLANGNGATQIVTANDTEDVAQDVAIDIRDSNAEQELQAAAAAAAMSQSHTTELNEQSLEAVGSTSIHNVTLAAAPSAAAAVAPTAGASSEAIDLSASPRKLAQPKALLTPSSVV